MAAEKLRLGPKWLQKTSNGQKIQFVVDSGSVRTIVPPEVAKGITIMIGRGNGGFRVANGHTIPYLGELKLEGLGEKGNVKMTAQVAAVAKPLASASEMTDSGNLVILHKTEGIVKTLSRIAEEKIRDIVKAEEGPETVLGRKAGAFKFDIEMQGGRGDEELQVPKKTVRFKRSREMHVDEAGIEKRYYDALWEDSPGLEDETTGSAEEELQCQKCQPAQHACGHVCNHCFHRRRGPTVMEKIA